MSAAPPIWMRVSGLWLLAAASSCVLYVRCVHCEGLTIASQSDWRLPSSKELQTIIDETLSDPAVDPAFTATPSDVFWSSTPIAGAPGFAATVFFFDGVTGSDQTSATYLVRCVR